MTNLVSGMNHQVTPTKYLLQIQVTWELLNSPMDRDSELGHHLVVCFSHVSTPLKNMKVSWDDSSQYMESHKNVPNHQPAMDEANVYWAFPIDFTQLSAKADSPICPNRRSMG